MSVLFSLVQLRRSIRAFTNVCGMYTCVCFVDGDVWSSVGASAGRTESVVHWTPCWSAELASRHATGQCPPRPVHYHWPFDLPRSASYDRLPAGQPRPGQSVHNLFHTKHVWTFV